MASDTVLKLGNSIVQHGAHNDRVYVMKLAEEDLPGIISALDCLAESRAYSKIIVKVPEGVREEFLRNGYVVEATIPGFFNAARDVYFMGKYRCDRRCIAGLAMLELDEIIRHAAAKPLTQQPPALPLGYSDRIVEKHNIAQMVRLYRRVFKTYPFPILDPEYLCGAMDDNVVYFGIFRGDELVAAASAEMDIASQNVEMTDFATLPEHRDRGYARYLLARMEDAMRESGILTAYTIARATSYGINIAFATSGYCYGGTLHNNTNISGSLESMNVWSKRLA